MSAAARGLYRRCRNPRRPPPRQYITDVEHPAPGNDVPAPVAAPIATIGVQR